jgi:uncharacterized protein
VPDDRLRPLRVNAVELLRQPGAVREVTATVAADAVDARHDRLAGDLEVELRLDVRSDGITVTGTVAAPWATVCRRCLTPVSGLAVSEIGELYQTEVVDPEAFPIEHGQLDLVPLVREAALLELDRERQCRHDCAGLCPVCGIDRNTASCTCDVAVTDERWAALEGFVPED